MLLKAWSYTVLAAALGPLPPFQLQKKRCQQREWALPSSSRLRSPCWASNLGNLPLTAHFQFLMPTTTADIWATSPQRCARTFPATRAGTGREQAGFSPSPTHPPLGKQGARLESLTRCLHQRQEHNSPLTIITGLRQLCWCAGLGLSG